MDDRGDRGFTLIELVVVVLVIAILLAIAVPTFFGLRERALDRAVQTNIKNAHTNQLAYYADEQQFVASVAALQALEPALSYAPAASDLSGERNQVHVSVSTTSALNDTVVIGARSKTGTCFWMRTVGSDAVPRFATAPCDAAPGPNSPSWETQWRS